jgi:hypothetical protein
MSRRLKSFLQTFPYTAEYTLLCDLFGISLIAAGVFLVPLRLIQLAGGV